MNIKFTRTTSFLLNLIRFATAQVVLIGHSLYVFDINVPLIINQKPAGSIQNLGVVVFLVLSGFLISYTVHLKKSIGKYTFQQYLLERITRIYSGYIPAILFVLILDFIQIHFLEGYQYSHNYNIQTLIGNLVMLQDIPISIHLPNLKVACLGSGRPFWSLAVEWWFYMIYGFIVVALHEISFYTASKRFIVIILMIPAAIFTFYHTIFVVNTEIPARGDVCFIIWLLGVGMFFILNNFQQRLSSSMNILLIVIFIALAFTRFYFIRFAYDLPLALLLTMIIFFMVQYCQKYDKVSPKIINGLINFGADYSFTLYLTHYTILNVIATNLHYGSPRFKLLITIIVSNIVAILIALPTEMQHKKVRKYIFNRFNL